MTSIRCGRCGKHNAPEARFCIYCGSPLAIASREQDQATTDEIRQLRDLIAQINTRLDALEGKLSPAEAPPPPAPTPEPVEPVAAITEPEPIPEPIAAPEVEVPPAPVEKERPVKKEWEWEQVLGGNWLARIGVLALIIGIGFFLKYAFDNNWLGPAARVILGVIAGLIMLGLGYYWRQKYPILTRVLSGGGIAVLYLSVFASSATYDLISVYLAVAFLFIISGIATLLALRYESMTLAILGILGAFFAPFILDAFGDRITDTGVRGQAIQLLLYIIVVDIGVLVLSTFRNWRWFTLLALACSLITYGFWHGEYHNEVGIAAKEIGITAIFLSFVGATYLFHIIRRHAPRVFDYVLISGNATAYAGISLSVMWDKFEAWMGGFMLLLAIFYGLLSYLAHRRNRENNQLAGFSLAIALIFLTVAIPVQFRDHVATTIAWAAEFVLLIWFSFRLRMPTFRNFSFAVFLATSVRLLFFDTTININNFTPFLNERFLAFVIGIAATYLSVFILWKHREVFPDWHIPASTLLVFVNFFTVWILSFEVWQSFSNPIIAADQASRKGLENAQNLSLTAVWAIYAVAGLVIGIWRKWRRVRIGSLALLAVPIVKVFVYDVFNLELGYRIGAFVGLGLLLLASAYLYQRYSKVIKGVFTSK